MDPSTKPKTISTEELAQGLRSTSKTLLSALKMENGPFTEGRDFHYQGLTKGGAVRWIPEVAEESWTTWVRPIETMEGSN